VPITVLKKGTLPSTRPLELAAMPFVDLFLDHEAFVHCHCEPLLHISEPFENEAIEHEQIVDCQMKRSTVMNLFVFKTLFEIMTWFVHTRFNEFVNRFFLQS